MSGNNPEFKFRFTGDLSALRSSLRQVSADLGKTKADGEAAGKGVASGANSARAAMDGLRSATRRASNEQRDLNRQMQLAAPQITDVFVSLASGQSPFLVALQQGGQLRDVFGGIRPAIAGVGTALVSLINPATIAVAAVAGIGFALLKGAEEGLRFNRVLALTGESAGKTAGDLQAMASRLDDIDGVTRSSASATLTAIVQSGRFTAEQFEIVARASEQMREATGQDVGSVIAEFEKLADSPVDAVLALNQKYGFLTSSILEQIKSLQDQGRQQEAATLAMQAFANAVDSRAPQVVENLGYIQSAIRFVRDGFREAYDAALDFGRVKTGTERIVELNEERASLRGAAASGNQFARVRIKDIEDEIRATQAAEESARSKAEKAAAQKRAIALQGELDTEARQYESKQERRARTRIAAINRAEKIIEAATTAEAVAAAKKSRDQIIAGLDKEAADEAKRDSSAGARAARSAAKRSAEAAREAANLVRIESSLVEDAARRALSELDRLYDEGAISIQDFYAQKQALELQAIDAAIKAAEAQRNAAVDIDDRKQAEAEILKLQRERAEVATRAAREQAAAERELNNELALLQARLAESSGKLGEVQRVQLEREREALLQKFQTNPGAQQLVRDLFDVELAKARSAAIDAEREKIVRGLRDETDYLASQADLGALSPIDAERQLQEVRQRSIEQLEELRAKAEAAYQARPTEETLQALRQLDTEILQIRASQNQLTTAMRDGAINALGQFFTDLSTGAKSFKEAFKDMVRSFIQGLARMVAEALAKQAILAILNAFSGGTASAAAAAGGAVAGVGTRHSGGMAGLGPRRQIPREAFVPMFASAPRFHSGGMILKAGEVPAILQTGERVLSRKETADYGRSQTAGRGTRVVNVFDSAFVPDQMDSADGERVILNVIGRNPGRVRQLLG